LDYPRGAFRTPPWPCSRVPASMSLFRAAPINPASTTPASKCASSGPRKSPNTWRMASSTSGLPGRDWVAETRSKIQVIKDSLLQQGHQATCPLGPGRSRNLQNQEGQGPGGKTHRHRSGQYDQATTSVKTRSRRRSTSPGEPPKSRSRNSTMLSSTSPKPATPCGPTSSASSIP
jgi:hypothetical protein